MLRIVLLALTCGLFEPLFCHEIYENTAEGVIYEHMVDSKIASGTNANRTIRTDYVLLSVVFINQAQICGGTLIKDSWVLTSATCLFDPVEGIASYVYAALRGSGKPTIAHVQIIIHPDYNPSNYTSDIALLKLATSAKVDGRKIILATLATDQTSDLYVDNVLVYCGWGTIKNKPTPPKGLQCTTLYGATAETCGTVPNTVCTKWTTKDNNVCPGDFGGPLYLVSGSSQVVVAIASYSADIRPATPCLDGHSTTHTQVAFYSTWISENAV